LLVDSFLLSLDHFSTSLVKEISGSNLRDTEARIILDIVQTVILIVVIDVEKCECICHCLLVFGINNLLHDRTLLCLESLDRQEGAQEQKLGL
jgi:hypothetical protein